MGAPKLLANRELESLLAESGYSNAALARQVNLLGARLHGLDLRYDASSVNRWLRGATPAAVTVDLVVEVLTRRLGQAVDRFRLFRGSVDLDYLTFPATPAAAVEAVAGLWRDTVRRRDLLGLAFTAAASTDAGWAWAFDTRAGVIARTGTVRVGMADVERLRAAREDFARLDMRHGGGHAKAWLADYLDREASPLLHGTYTDEVGRELFAAVALLTETVSYMAFDEAQHGLAQRYSIHALALAKHGDDREFGAYVMSNMSAQAVFLGQPDRAVQLARAGVASAPRSAPPGLLARLLTTEARGHAQMGNLRECRAALRAAKAAQAKADRSGSPAWLGASTPAHLAGSEMHCLFDLGRPAEAARFIGQALDLPAGNARARALHEILAARVQIDQGDIEGSCDTAWGVVRALGQMRSRRLLERVHDYRRHLAHHITVPAARDWLDETRAALAT